MGPGQEGRENMQKYRPAMAAVPSSPMWFPSVTQKFSKSKLQVSQ